MFIKVSILHNKARNKGNEQVFVLYFILTNIVYVYILCYRKNEKNYGGYYGTKFKRSIWKSE